MNITAITALITVALAVGRAYREVAGVQRIRAFHERAAAATTVAEREAWEALAQRASFIYTAKLSGDFETSPFWSLATLRQLLLIIGCVTAPTGIILAEVWDRGWLVLLGAIPIYAWLIIPSPIAKTRTEGRKASQERVNQAVSRYAAALQPDGELTPLPEADDAQATDDHEAS